MTIEIELEDTIIPALGHDYIHHAKVDATCVNDGLHEHYTCSRCGNVFDLNKVETNLEDLVISALGHNYIAVVTNPTCEADGYTTYTCSICGDSYVSDLVNALGPDYEISYIWNSDNSKAFASALCNTCGDSIYEEAIVVSTIKNPTCKQEGLVTYKAEFTNSIFATQIKEEVLDKLSHTEGDAVIENLVSSTCSEEGSYDSVVYCTVCHD
jgi:DNA-directed RNA polymerase subunit RPC12/RpoP